jgi:hypothetical protein
VSERLCVQVVVDAGGIDQLVLYTQRMLGEGSTGTVFEGWYQGQVCAVKRMNETDRGALREIDAYRSQKLRHPSLVHMQTVKSEYQLLYLAMDLCHCSLSTTTVREATWTQPTACTGVLCFARRCSDCPIILPDGVCVVGPSPSPLRLHDAWPWPCAQAKARVVLARVQRDALLQRKLARQLMQVCVCDRLYSNSIHI